MEFQFTPEQCKTLLNAARDSIRAVLNGQPQAEMPSDTDPALLQQAGCFVTLHDLATHQLRGCIGRIVSPDPLFKSVQGTAAGALEDPRFVRQRVTLAQLPSLQIDISVLSPLQPAANVLDFDPKTHGIFLTFGQKTGVFLPQVGRETGWSREQLLARLCTEKMGLPPMIWQNPHARLLRFESFMVGPEPFEPSSLPANSISTKA